MTEKLKRAVWILVATLIFVCVAFCVLTFLPERANASEGVSKAPAVIVGGSNGDSYSDDSLTYAMEYDTSGGGCVWTGFTAYNGGAKVDLVIPAKVTGINLNAGSNKGLLSFFKPNLVSISFETGSRLTSFGTDFQGLEGLTSVSFENAESLTQINAQAFYNCKYLESLSLKGAKKLTTIGASAFEECQRMQYADLFSAEVASKDTGTALKTIGSYAFKGCAKLHTVAIPDSVSSIGDQAFFGCQTLHSINLPSSLVKPADLSASTFVSAFNSCHKLAEVENNSPYTEAELRIYAGFENALNIYDPDATSGNNKPYLFKTTNNLVFCKNTGRTSALAAGANYTIGNWYFIQLDNTGYEWTSNGETPLGTFSNSADMAPLYKLPEEISLAEDFDTAKSLDPTVYDLSIEKRVVNDSHNSAYAYIDSCGKWNRIDFNDAKYNADFPSGRKITSYDIGSHACFWIWCMKIEIPDAVKVVGNNAFNGASVSGVKLGRNLTHVGTNAFGGGGNEKFIHVEKTSGVTYGDNVFTTSGANETKTKNFIFPNSSSVVSGSPFNIVGANRTYYVNIVPNVVEGNSVTKLDPVVGLHGKSAAYTRQWDYRWKEGEFKLPTAPGYSSTVWYRNKEFASSLTADAAWITEQLKQTGDTINVYANKVAVPSFSSTAIDRSYRTEGYTLQSVDEGTVLHEAGLTNLSDYNVRISSYTDMSGAETTDLTDTSLTDAGVYKLSVELNTKWGTFAGDTKPAVITVKIDKQIINLNGYDALHWVQKSNGSQLSSGDLYYYSEDGYHTQPKQTEPEDTLAVNHGYVGYSVNPQSIVLSDTLKSDIYGITYGGDTNVTAVGQYSATATLTLDGAANAQNNYVFYIDAYSQDLVSRQIIVTGDAEGFGFNRYTRITVSKRWYIVNVGNKIIVQGTSDDYEVVSGNSWTYGDSVTLNKPTAVHTQTLNGDVSSEVTLTFVLSRFNGTTYENVGTDEQLSVKDRFDDYINTSMPVGRYRVRINVPRVVTEDTTYYPVDMTYNFTVNEKPLAEAQKNAVNNALKNASFEHLADGNAHFYKEEQINNAAYAEALKNLLATDPQTERKGVWATDSEYFNAFYGNFRITYTLDGIAGNAYYDESSFSDTRLTAPRARGQYTVYYRLTAPNYAPLVNTSVELERREYKFDVTVYEHIDLFTLDNVTYTGGDALANIPANANYRIVWNTEAGYYVNATKGNADRSAREVRLVVNNPTLFRWNPDTVIDGVREFSGDTATLYYEIEKAQNGFNPNATPRVSSWQWKSFDPDLNVIVAEQKGDGEKILYSVYKITDGETEYLAQNFSLVGGKVPSEIVNKLNTLNVGDKYFLTAEITEGYNYSAYSWDANFPLEVTKAYNSFEITPSFTSWNYKDFDEDRNFISGATLYGADETTITYGIYFDAAHTSAVTNLASFTDVSAVVTYIDALESGRYYLYASANGGTNYSGATAASPFVVLAADNSWKTPVELNGWTYGDGVTWNAPVPVFSGTVTYSLTGGSLASPITSITSAALSALSAGSYTLTVRVAEGVSSLDTGDKTILNYKAMTDVVYFEVSKAAGGFTTNPSAAGWTYGQSKPTHSSGTPIDASATVSTGYYKAVYRDNAWVMSDKLTESELEDGMPKNAGDYFWFVEVGATANYEKNEASVLFSVAKATNGFKGGTPVLVGWTYGEYLKSPWTMPTVEEGTVSVRLSTETNQIEDIDAKFASLDAGNYTLMITVSVPENGNYTQVPSVELPFTVGKADNEWTVNPASWVKSWTWGVSEEDFAWSNPQVKYEAAQSEVIITVESEDHENIVTSNLRTLNAGTYTLTARALETKNYHQMTTTGIVVKIEKVRNGWLLEPQINDWVVGGMESNVVAIPQYGERTDVVFKYYKATQNADGTWSKDESTESGRPSAAGDYILLASTPSGTNWYSVSNEYHFKIEQAVVNWIVTPNVSRWNWHEYDKTVNLFTALPTSRGKVTYEIRKIDGSKIEGLDAIELDGSGFVDDATAKTLYDLPSGDYYLIVHVAATNDYGAYDYGTNKELTFDVGRASNYWEESLDITRWMYGQYNANSIFVTAKVRYGDITVRITEEAGGEAVYEEVILNDGTRTTNVNNLANAQAGKYMLTADVPETNDYEGLAARVVFEIFPTDYETMVNYWDVLPNIQSWTFGEQPSVPVGAAHFGRVVFRYRLRDEADHKATETVPTAPGKYTMIVNALPEGVHRGLTAKVDFEIYEKPLLTNSFVVNPNMKDWILGQTGELVWQAEACDSYTIVYMTADGTVIDGVPSELGEYKAVITVEADGYKTLTATVDFSVVSDDLSGEGVLTAVCLGLVLTAIAAGVVAIIFVGKNVSGKRRKV